MIPARQPASWEFSAKSLNNVKGEIVQIACGCSESLI
jgi:hypothetical protein